jgi:ribonuclease HI
MADGETTISVDAAFQSSSGEATVGMIALDKQGMPRAVASIEKCCDAEEAEARAIQEGLKLGIEFNLNPVVVQSDCAAVVYAANSSSVNSYRYWSIYKSISKLRESSPRCSIIKIDRKINGYAHNLAKLACQSGSSNVWLPPLPAAVLAFCEQNIVSDDVINI